MTEFLSPLLLSSYLKFTMSQSLLLTAFLKTAYFMHCCYWCWHLQHCCDHCHPHLHFWCRHWLQCYRWCYPTPCFTYSVSIVITIVKFGARATTTCIITDNPIFRKVLDIKKILSTYTWTLDLPMPSHNAFNSHIITGLSFQYLITSLHICEHGCTVALTNTKCYIYHKGENILTGTQEFYSSVSPDT